jgi:L-lactate utilization protein LutC
MDEIAFERQIEQHLDQVRRLVAERHNVSIGRDDPILMLMTAQDHLLQLYTQRQRELVAEFAAQLDAVATRYTASSKETADKALTAALAASKQAMVSLLEGGTTAALEPIQTWLARSLAALDQSYDRARHVSWINLVAAAISLASVALLLAR